MVERRFVPKEAIEERKAWIKRSSERARLSPQVTQARLDTIEVAEMIFSAKPVSNKA